MRAIRCCALAASIVVPLSVSAGEVRGNAMGVLAVAPPPGPGPALVDLTAQLRDELAAGKRPGLSLLDAAQLRLRMGEPSADAALSEANRSYQAAIGADLSNDPERAIAILRATVEDLERLPESEEAFRQWKRAMLRLAKIEAQMQAYARDAPAVVERLLRADPALEVDPEVHGAEVARLAQSVRRQLRTLPERRLTVSSPSKGVRVFVNGHQVGSASPGAPLVLTLRRGRYRVSGQEGKLRAPAQDVDLTGGDQAVAFDFSIARMLRPGLGPGLALAGNDHPSILRAGGYLGLDTLLATSTREEEGVSYLLGATYDVPAGKLRLAGVLRLGDSLRPEPGGMKALADFLASGPSPDGGPVKPYDPLQTSKLGDLFPREKPRTLGWAAFGAGVGAIALGGVAIWQGLASNRAFSDAKAMRDGSGNILPPNTVAGYNRKVSDGESARTISIGTGVGAGVALVATGVLGYLSYRQTGEMGPFRF
jgi:hypothetical protein